MSKRSNIIRGKEDLWAVLEWQDNPPILDYVKGTEVLGDISVGSRSEVRYKQSVCLADILFTHPKKEIVQAELSRLETLRSGEQVNSDAESQSNEDFQENEDVQLSEDGNKIQAIETPEVINEDLEIPNSPKELIEEHDKIAVVEKEDEPALMEEEDEPAAVEELPGSSENESQNLSDSDNDPLYECTTSVDSSSEEEPVKKPLKLQPTSRKRKRNADKYADNVIKQKRTSGEEYFSRKGKKVVSARVIGQDCNCRMKCFTKFDEDTRKKIFKEFYSLQNTELQTCYIFKHIIKQKIQRKRPIAEKPTRKPKLNSFTYELPASSNPVQVCKKAFCNILAISDKRVRCVRLQIVSGRSAPLPDGRKTNKGKVTVNDEIHAKIVSHIQSFPSVPSHYSRTSNPNRRYLDQALNIRRMYYLFLEKFLEHVKPKKKVHAPNEEEEENLASSENDEHNIDRIPVSEASYRKIFNGEFNLDFLTPKSDVCATCEKMKLQVAATEDPAALANELAEHQAEAALGQKLISKDIKEAKTHRDLKHLFISLDLQQALNVPTLNVSEAFYCRKISLYNLGIHVLNNEKGYMYLWTEDVAGRGSDEIGSCLKKFLEKMKTVEKLTLWTDSCVGQNKNYMLFSLELDLVNKGICQEIHHKFPTPGHTMLPSDRDFGLIEQEKRNHWPCVYDPDCWVKLIKNARRNKPFHTTVMGTSDFYEIRSLKPKYGIQTMRNTKGEKMNINKVAHVKFTKNRIDYKYLNSSEEWNTINVETKKHPSLRNALSSQSTDLGAMPLKYQNKRPISKEKLDDVAKLLPYIPPINQKFYKTLKVSEAVKEDRDFLDE